MRERPTHVTDHDLLDLVRDHWSPQVVAVEHLPVGFGAHHWRAEDADGSPLLFVTLDRLGDRHTPDSLEAAYAGAAGLAAQGLDFVLACRPGNDGRFTVAVGDHRLSATPWLAGRSGDGGFPDDGTARATGRMLARLHAVSRPPPGLPRWTPLVAPDLPDRLAERTATGWRSGPYGESARAALRGRLREIARWSADYLATARTTDPATWVATHGEPHTRNQLTTTGGERYLVDWETLRLAPRERDLRVLVDQGRGDLCETDPELVRMFDLEWRLDEISQYADWFEAPHTGTESDRVALDGLRHELSR